MTVEATNFNLNCLSCTDIQKKNRGCITDSPYGEFEFEGEVLKRCILKNIKFNSTLFVKFYSLFNKGFLPNTGAILDQPNKFIEAIQVIENVLGKRRNEESKVIERKVKRK